MNAATPPGHLAAAPVLRHPRVKPHSARPAAARRHPRLAAGAGADAALPGAAHHLLPGAARHGRVRGARHPHHRRRACRTAAWQISAARACSPRKSMRRWLDGRIDFAVHSLKDLETELPPGIVLACTLKREDARDALILGPGCDADDPSDPFACLPAGAVVGTASVRRQAQLLHARPDLTHHHDPRQRADTAGQTGRRRLRRLPAGAGRPAPARAWRSAPQSCSTRMRWCPAAGQGIVGITVREADDASCANCSPASRTRKPRRSPPPNAPCWPNSTAPAAPRSAAMRACCPNGTLHLTGLVARADGSFLLKRSPARRGAGRRAAGHGTRRQPAGRQPARPVCLSRPTPQPAPCATPS